MSLSLIRQQFYLIHPFMEDTSIVPLAHSANCFLSLRYDLKAPLDLPWRTISWQ
jgi:hypothetical protein